MLLYWSAADGAARRDAYDALAAAILCLGSSGPSRWTAAAAVLRQAQQRGADDLPSARAAGGGEQQTLHRVTLSDEPGQLFLLSRGARQVLQAGPDMQAFLDRATQLKQRGALQLEGVQYAVGDFRISLARAVQAPQQNFLGLAVDLGYLAVDDAALAAPLLQDLAEVLQEAAEAAGGRLQRLEDAATAGYQLPPQFTPRHRALQYTQLMSRLQEQAG